MMPPPPHFPLAWLQLQPGQCEVSWLWHAHVASPEINQVPNSVFACIRVTVDEMQRHMEFDIDTSGDVSVEEAMVNNFF